MATRPLFLLLCLTGFLLALSLIPQKKEVWGEFFSQNQSDSLYSITPTEDGMTGFHLWVWKPSSKSKMPVKTYDEYSDKEMNQNPLE